MISASRGNLLTDSRVLLPVQGKHVGLGVREMGPATLTVTCNLHCPLPAGEGPGVDSVSLLSTHLVRGGKPVAGRFVMAQRAGRVVWSAGCQGQCVRQQGWRERAKAPFGRLCCLHHKVDFYHREMERHLKF